jgi:phage shock protein E
MRRGLGLVAAALIALTGCSGGVSTSTGPTSSSAPNAGAALSPAEFAAAIKRPGTVVVDVRTPAEFASGHLPGAINLDLTGGTFAGKLPTLAKGVTYALYCHTGNRSGQALAAMRAAGFTSVFHLSGGISAWTTSGGDTTS